MATFRKTETGKQNQQRAIGNRPAIITRRGFAAKRIFEGLHLGPAPKQISAVPDKGAADAEQERRCNARGVRGRQPECEEAYAGGPLPVMAFPSRLGNSQSCQPPSASVHMTPNPAASSFFHGSRPHSPDKAYTTQIARSIQRGNTGVTEAVRRTMAGFMRALPDAGGQAL